TCGYLDSGLKWAVNLQTHIWDSSPNSLDKIVIYSAFPLSNQIILDVRHCGLHLKMHSSSVMYGGNHNGSGCMPMLQHIVCTTESSQQAIALT
ncbi:hypothetical protein ID866_11112, partial [Astraeus odoratus]